MTSAASFRDLDHLEERLWAIEKVAARDDDFEEAFIEVKRLVRELRTEVYHEALHVQPQRYGEEIPMRCSACGKPHPGFAKTAALARSYVCPCGSSKFEGTVTFRG